MGRLLNWPHGLAVIARQPLTGPRTVGAASNEGMTGYVQTVASAFGVWRWQFSLRPMRGRLFRRYRGMVTALHGGANAVRVPWCDPDNLSMGEAGNAATQEEIRNGVPWTNGASWTNDQKWSVARPWEAVAAVSVKGATTIAIYGAHWGSQLVGGEQIGFLPFHFGVYTITELIHVGDEASPPNASQYRIWPPLRKSISTTDYVTLNPVMVMRLESEAAGTASRGSRLAEGNALTLVEVEDEDVRDYFAD